MSTGLIPILHVLVLLQSLHRLKTADLLSFVTLHSALASGAATSLELSEVEAAVVYASVAPFCAEEVGEGEAVLGDVWGDAVVADAGVG